MSTDGLSNYQVELNFTFSIAKAGEIAGGGSGSYTDATGTSTASTARTGASMRPAHYHRALLCRRQSSRSAAARRTSRSRCPTPPRRTLITIAGPATPVTPPLRTYVEFTVARWRRQLEFPASGAVFVHSAERTSTGSGDDTRTMSTSGRSRSHLRPLRATAPRARGVDPAPAPSLLERFSPPVACPRWPARHVSSHMSTSGTQACSSSGRAVRTLSLPRRRTCPPATTCWSGVDGQGHVPRREGPLPANRLRGGLQGDSHRRDRPHGHMAMAAPPAQALPVGRSWWAGNL